MSAGTDKTTTPYVRLARARGGVGSYASLWLGGDHLLLVTSSGYHERYQRFHLGEIKGFFITRSRIAAVTLLVSGAIALTAAIAGCVIMLDGGMPVWPWFVLVPAVIFLVLGGLFGRNCRVHAVTGVQTALLVPLARRRQTGKILERLRPLIEEAQAGLEAASPPSGPPSPPPVPLP